MDFRSSRGDTSNEEDDYNTDDERQQESANKKRKVKYVQKFRYEWLQNKDFKSRLTPRVKGKYQTYVFRLLNYSSVQQVRIRET